MDAVDYMLAGEFVKAKEIFESNPLTSTLDLANYAKCLLNTGEFTSAIEIYEGLVHKRPDIDSYRIYSGICFWSIGEPAKASVLWREAQNCEYTDAAGGAIPVALTYYSAIRGQGDLTEATTVMRKLWKPSLVKTWPGPIIGYLLGKVAQADLLGMDPFLNATMKIRTDCQALFWCGVAAVRDGTAAADDLFARSCSTGPEAILEPEYYLARYEAGKVPRA